jgi:hypothetical protein
MTCYVKNFYVAKHFTVSTKNLKIPTLKLSMHLCIFCNRKWTFVGKIRKIEPYPTRVANKCSKIHSYGTNKGGGDAYKSS